MPSSGDIMSANTVRQTEKALKLRREGKTYQEIADELQLSNKGNAHRLVKRALKMTLQEDADGVRALDGSRLEALIAAHWNAATGVTYDDDQKAVAPDPAAGNLVLRAVDRHIKLYGADMPSKHELTGAGGSPLIVEILADILPTSVSGDGDSNG